MIKHPFILAAALSAAVGTALAAPAANWPAPVKALETQGVEVMGRFDAPGGLQGYAAVMQQKPLAIYVTADGKQAIVGTMLDAKGANLSEAPLEKLVSKPMTEKTWAQLEKSSWIADGSKNAKRVVYTFTDPNCPYCNKFWNDARPWIKGGNVQIRHIMVGIIKDTSAGKAAALLTAKDQQAALTLHERQHANGGIKPLEQIPKNIRTQLDNNQKLMQQLGFFATPTVFYKDASGVLQTAQGAPRADMLNTILGQR
ncbi:Thiol:disulfide interchange protein DsbC [Collimonas sp. OK607]|uniref:thiol:disulfide interchange protein DsbG n=1 Tax=Collimonas sp. OK607 TaxID=1798194 RepID=UPI0008EE9705|nr:thiol:disulfide interchange protein DsbG [Collimonas sp. OK607]SFB04756.1 Thiol:disulfide interchange protein DsbC [Collimonas sp. OK607]